MITKTLLMPFNMKDDNRCTFNHAVELAKRENGEVIMLSTFHCSQQDGENTESFHARERKIWYEHFWHYFDLKSNYGLQHPDDDRFKQMKFHLEFRNRQMEQEIFHLIRERKVDYFICGLHKGPANACELDNTLIRKVAREVECPMLIIPAEKDYRPITNIAYTTDFHKFSNSIARFEEATALADSYEADIHYLHILEKGKNEEIEDGTLLKQIADKTKHNGRYHFDIIESPSVFGSLKQYAARNEIDCLMVVRQDHGFLEELLDHSFSEKAALYSGLPVLLYHE